MSSGAEVVSKRPIRGQEARGMPRGLAPLHALRPLAQWPMRVVAPVMERATLAMSHPGPDLPLGRTVALPLLRHDHP